MNKREKRRILGSLWAYKIAKLDRKRKNLYKAKWDYTSEKLQQSTEN